MLIAKTGTNTKLSTRRHASAVYSRNALFWCTISKRARVSKLGEFLDTSLSNKHSPAENNFSLTAGASQLERQNIFSVLQAIFFLCNKTRVSPGET